MTSVMFVLYQDDDQSGAKMECPNEEQESRRTKPIFHVGEPGQKKTRGDLGRPT